MTRFSSKARTSLPALACVALGLYACSLQDFEYLQEGEAGAPSGGKGGSAGSSSGSSGTGGSSGSSAGSSNPSAGGSGDEAGQGGEAGISGASGEGGAPAGGTSAGTTSAGGAPSAGQGGEGGVPTGAGGDVGTGGTAGDSSDGGLGGQPPRVGNLLDNPSFELSLTGWTVNPPEAANATLRYIYTQAHSAQNVLPGGGSSQLATWHGTDEYEVTIYQRVTRLEPGTYTFKGWFSTTSTRQAYVFARNCEEPDMPDITVDVPAVAWEWFEITIPNINVSASSCEVGLFVHAIAAGNNGMPDWLNADLFSFEKDP